MGCPVPLSVFALAIALCAYLWQFDAIITHIIGDYFHCGNAVNARLPGAFIGSVPHVGTMLNR